MHLHDRRTLSLLLLATAATLSACGGGGTSTAEVPTPPPPPPPSAAQTAAAATAKNNPLCQAIQPFYWEVGDKNGMLGGGSVGASPPTQATTMAIASASKWPFAAYVIQKYGTSIGATSLVPYLNFTSGYSNFDNALCSPSQTVAECNNGGVNATEAAAHAFHYSGGHMQQLAAGPLGLGSMGIVALAAEVDSVLGSDVGFEYVEPQPPGGINTTPARYAVFLRKLMAGASSPLALGGMLSDHAVCTQASASCNAALASESNALPPDDNFHYGLGHWIEDDPTAMPAAAGITTANWFAYSSAGAHGFYPWISMDRTLYGMVARQAGTGETNGTGEGFDSLVCGRMIRLAWTTGVERTETPR